MPESLTPRAASLRPCCTKRAPTRGMPELPSYAPLCARALAALLAPLREVRTLLGGGSP